MIWETYRTWIFQVQSQGSSCSVKEFVNGDSDLPVCQDIIDDKWEQEFLDQVAKTPSSDVTEETTRSSENDSESESEEEEEQNVVPRIKNIKEAIHALEEVTLFLDYKGYADEAYKTSNVVDSVARLHSLSSARQTMIYFN